jgi:hypothetical protein
MARARSNLSDNIASLKLALAEKEALLAEQQALLIERDRVIAARDAELYAKTLQIEHLKAQLAVLRRARFGRSSEQLDREIEQLELILGVQGLDHPLRVLLHGCLRNLTSQFENELRSIVVPVSPHGPTPSFLKERIVRLASESR